MQKPHSGFAGRPAFLILKGQLSTPKSHLEGDGDCFTFIPPCWTSAEPSARPFFLLFLSRKFQQTSGNTHQLFPGTAHRSISIVI